MKPNAIGEEARAVEAIVSYLSGVPFATRKEVLSGAIAAYGLSAEELQDKSPRGKNCRIRSGLGTVLNRLTQQKAVGCRDGVLFLNREQLVLVQEAQCEAALRELLCSRRKYRREELFRALAERFRTVRTPQKADDLTLAAMSERILSRMLEAGEAEQDGTGRIGGVRQADDAPGQPLSERECRERLLSRLYRRGGAHFEVFLANALEKYFLVTGRDVTCCEITGGSADGGIDIVIDTVDELGFAEHILVQAKCRRQAQTTEKEIREFYGALNAQRGSRGIFATTTSFHPAAQKLLDSLDNCVGIDGKKLFEILKKAEYGIHKSKSGYTLDTAAV